MFSINRSDQKAYLWIDGVLQTEYQGGTEIYLDSGATYSLASGGTDRHTIGGRQMDGWWFEGAIDNVWFWERGLTDTDAADFYNSGAGRTTPTSYTNGGNLTVESTTWAWPWGYNVSNALVVLAMTNQIPPTNCWADVSPDNGSHWTRVNCTASDGTITLADGTLLMKWFGTGTCAVAGQQTRLRVQTTNNAALRFYRVGVAMR